MALKIVRTPRARLDLVEIWNFIADDNEPAADRLLDKIEAVLRTLSENPLAGRARPELHEEIRSFPVGNYIVFYRPLSDAIEVVRVRSSDLDITSDDFN